MAVTFLNHPDPRTLPVRNRPALVGLEGGRSRAAARRRRMFMARRLGVLIVASATVAVAVSFASSGIGRSPVSAVSTSYEVNAGDTLWSIAGTVAGGADRREVVALLAQANGGTVVVPGQHLVIPADVVALAS